MDGRESEAPGLIGLGFDSPAWTLPMTIGPAHQSEKGNRMNRQERRKHGVMGRNKTIEDNQVQILKACEEAEKIGQAFIAVNQYAQMTHFKGKDFDQMVKISAETRTKGMISHPDLQMVKQVFWNWLKAKSRIWINKLSPSSLFPGYNHRNG